MSRLLKKSLEETGRIIRYHEMKKLSSKHDAYIATGHHSIDFLETIFINLIRGTGRKGLAPLPMYRDNIFRPLMKISLNDLNNAVVDSDWKIFQDESNEDELYLRNRIRKNIIPLLMKEGLNPNKLYDNFHGLHFFPGFREEKKTIPSMVKIDKTSIQSSNIQLLKEIVDLHLKIFFLHPVNKNFFSELIKHLNQGKSFLIENPEAYFWRKEKGGLFIIPKNSALLKSPEVVSQNGKSVIRWNQTEFYMDEMYKLGLYENGMEFFVNKMHKPVSEIFRENEIPVPIRKNIPILLKNGVPVKILFEMFDSLLKNLSGGKE